MALAMSSRRQLLDSAARLRASRAKGAVLLGAAAVFAAAFGVTRAAHPSHAKHPLRRLDPPADFLRVVEQDAQLQGGMIAAPEAPPEAVTAAS